MSIAEIEARALAIAAEFDRKLSPYRAQIVPDTTPYWHIVKTAPGQENKAATFLEDRCIGIFLPKFVRGARLVTNHELINLSDKLLFPGLIFVFVWDILTHWRRIMACPGVQSIMVDGNEKPVIVPDSEINHIQVLQYVLGISKPKRRKRYASANDRIVISTASYWHVDGKERNRLLAQQLGAAW
jgi:transcription antitermination factor NusG